MHLLDRIRRALHAIDAFDPALGQDEDLRAFAVAAYSQCVEWFGIPDDHRIGFSIVGGPYTALARDLISRQYVIVISNELRHAEPRFASIAHEMYHRVTMHRRGLREALWVDEMLAFLTTQRILCGMGFAEYADERLRRQREEASTMSVEQLRRARPLFRRYLWLSAVAYPAGFTAGSGVLGARLLEVVGWEHTARMIACHTWEQWLALLPESQVPKAVTLLEISLAR